VVIVQDVSSADANKLRCGQQSLFHQMLVHIRRNDERILRQPQLSAHDGQYRRSMFVDDVMNHFVVQSMLPRRIVAQFVAIVANMVIGIAVAMIAGVGRRGGKIHGGGIAVVVLGVDEVMDASERCDDRTSIGGFGVAALVGLKESVVEFAFGEEGLVSLSISLGHGSKVDIGSRRRYGYGCGYGFCGGCR